MDRHLEVHLHRLSVRRLSTNRVAKQVSMEDSQREEQCQHMRQHSHQASTCLLHLHMPHQTPMHQVLRTVALHMEVQLMEVQVHRAMEGV